MIEYTLQLDSVFGSLADPTRRDILKRVSRRELSISEVASIYPQSLAAISKHLQILEKARLIIKRRQGKQHLVSLSPHAFKTAADYLQNYEEIWRGRFDALEKLIEREQQK